MSPLPIKSFGGESEGGRVSRQLVGRCEGCGIRIYADDQFCYDGTGHVTIGYTKDGEPELQPCGPIDYNWKETHDRE